MLFIFSTPELIRYLWQLKTAIFLHWCLMCAVPLIDDSGHDQAHRAIPILIIKC